MPEPQITRPSSLPNDDVTEVSEPTQTVPKGSIRTLISPLMDRLQAAGESRNWIIGSISGFAFFLWLLWSVAAARSEVNRLQQAQQAAHEAHRQEINKKSLDSQLAWESYTAIKEDYLRLKKQIDDTEAAKPLGRVSLKPMPLNDAVTILANTSHLVVQISTEMETSGWAMFEKPLIQKTFRDGEAWFIASGTVCQLERVDQAWCLVTPLEGNAAHRSGWVSAKTVWNVISEFHPLQSVTQVRFAPGTIVEAPVTAGASSGPKTWYVQTGNVTKSGRFPAIDVRTGSGKHLSAKEVFPIWSAHPLSAFAYVVPSEGL